MNEWHVLRRDTIFNPIKRLVIRRLRLAAPFPSRQIMAARTWIRLALVLGCLACEVAAEEGRDEPIAPAQTIQLFNGRDLAGLTTWLKDTKRDDPRKVFQVTDGMIHLSGEGNGYVATEKEYRDYHLVVEYKWGQRTDGGKYVRNSGILLHAIGPDGGAGGAWPSCIECQLAQGCVGDLIVIRGKDAKGEVIPVQSHGRNGARARRPPPSLETGRGRQIVPANPRPVLVEQARLGFQGAARHPRPRRRREPARRVDPRRVPLRRPANHDQGQRPDGQRVLRCLSRGGRILLQTEGFEILFRKFEIHPLNDRHRGLNHKDTRCTKR